MTKIRRKAIKGKGINPPHSPITYRRKPGSHLRLRDRFDFRDAREVLGVA